MDEALVTLPSVSRLSNACLRIIAGNPGKFTLQGTNTYLVGTGLSRLLIDSGEGLPAWSASLACVLSQEGAVVQSVLLTHGHHDHVLGVSDLLALCPGAHVYKHMPEPGTGQLDICDGQTFSVEGATIRAMHTPGHTADHTTFILEEEDAMFTGDAVLGQGTTVFDDLDIYLQSLKAIRNRFAGRVYPGHGPVVEDGPGRIGEYIEHRERRERQILDALDNLCRRREGKSCTAMDIVKVVYRDVPVSLHDAARGGVFQVLAKLRGEGVVVSFGNKDPNAAEWNLATCR